VTALLEGFELTDVSTPRGRVRARVGGSGPPLLLLHGFPQTHLMWHAVAPLLAEAFTVVAADLPGYGGSFRPPAEPDHAGHAKRALAADLVAAMAQLGHERFAVAGHDRGALVAFRAALDHPDVVTHVACLDVLPTLDMWDVLHGAGAAVAFHLYLMAQPPDLPEAMIAASADAFFGHFLDVWIKDPSAIPPEVRAAYLSASREAVTSIVADYRASAGVDVADDQADRDAGHVLPMPVSVLQQDWGAALGYDAAAVWRAWAPDLVHTTVDCGHFMAEEAPEVVADAVRALAAR
jgi:haloacetate dehalogenase